MKKSMKASLVLNVNGKDRSLRVAPETPLLYALRNNLELNGPKFGCGLEQCGACMVLLNGKANPSCRIPVSEVIEKKIVTIEGLAENGNLHPLQQAFIDEQAAQCGYCLNGVLINSFSLLNENKDPTADEIKNGLEKNICRCGTHSRFIKAIKKVSKS